MRQLKGFIHVSRFSGELSIPMSRGYYARDERSSSRRADTWDAFEKQAVNGPWISFSDVTGRL